MEIIVVHEIDHQLLTIALITEKMAIVQYRVKKVSARTPPSKHRRYDVPPKFELMFEEVALGRCIVPIKYVTRFTTIAIVESLSDNSTPKKSNNSAIIILHVSCVQTN